MDDIEVVDEGIEETQSTEETYIAFPNKGDTISFTLDFLIDGKTPLEKDAYHEMELQLNEEGGTRKNIKLLLSAGQIQWDDDLGKYVVSLTQDQTFMLPNRMEYQLRILDEESEEIYSSKIGYFCLGDVLSKTVLE